ncbi:MAG TPA: glycosyltransferase [Candidatus Dormibacteraeota bacterium]|nr:glycosyltransferase [Candidatus Dormibacteraeota bacterium]
MVAFAWSPFQARTEGLAKELGGEARFVAGRRLRRARWQLPLRYVRDGIDAWRQLRRLDPRVVIVITPPVFAPLVAWLWCRVHRRPLVIDCHTLALHSRKWAWALPLHRFLMRRSRAVLVHTQEALAEVRGWGVHVMVLPDELPDPALAREPKHGGAPRVLIAGSLDWDEPVAAVVEAARQVPAMELRLTGDPARVSAGVRAAAPPNAVFTGWLDYPTFLGEVRAADVVAAFTGLPGVMNRAAFEAVALGKPLVLTDLPEMRERFGQAALFTTNDPTDMARTVSRAYEEREALAARSLRLQTDLRAARLEGLTRLRTLLTEPPRRARRMLLVSQHAYPDAPLLRRNVEHLAAQGMQIDLICMEPANPLPPSSFLPGMRIFALPVQHRREHRFNYVVEFAAFFLLSFPIVTALGLRRRYDAIQVDNLPDFLPFVAIVPRLRGARVVFYMYDMFPELAMTRLGLDSGHPIIKLARQIERWALRWVDHAVVVTDLFRRTLVSRGVDAAKISVVYNTQPLTVAMRKPSNGSPRLVTHASLVERYGVQVAIRALPILRDAWPDLTYDVLGRGEYQPALERLATELRVRDAVTFGGFLPWPEAMERISSATLGIVPVIADGFGEFILPMKLLEYVGMGIPVVCARLPGIEEHFDPESVAFFTPGDCEGLARQVDRLLNDPVAAERQAARASQALESLRWETVAPRYLAALHPMA